MGYSWQCEEGEKGEDKELKIKEEMVYYDNNTKLPPNCNINIKDKDKNININCDKSGCKIDTLKENINNSNNDKPIIDNGNKKNNK